jgi:AcrR family transcriptional regulator
MPSTTDTRPLRSDARRNRERIVTSARALFARAGLDASVEDITNHAGIGMGTLYRHFPTKEALIDAVLEDAFAEFVGLAKTALAEPDPWTGLCWYLERSLAMLAANRGLKDVAATREHGLSRAAAIRRELRPLLLRLVERAQAQGSLRADLSPEDIPLLLWAGDGVIECAANVDPQVWRRYLGLLMDGLRSDAATPQEYAPLTRAQVDRASRSPR